MYAHPVYWLETFIDPGAFPRDLLPRGQLAAARTHNRAWQKRSDEKTKPPNQGSAGAAIDTALSRVTESVMKSKSSRRHMDVNVDELDRILDGATQTPDAKSDCQKVKAACTPWRKG